MAAKSAPPLNCCFYRLNRFGGSGRYWVFNRVSTAAQTRLNGLKILPLQPHDRATQKAAGANQNHLRRCFFRRSEAGSMLVGDTGFEPESQRFGATRSDRHLRLLTCGFTDSRRHALVDFYGHEYPSGGHVVDTNSRDRQWRRVPTDVSSDRSRSCPAGAIGLATQTPTAARHQAANRSATTRLTPSSPRTMRKRGWWMSDA